MYYPDIYPEHSHNIFLNMAVELGIPGLVIFSLIVLIILKVMIGALRREREIKVKILLAGFFASTVGFLSLNLFDYMYHGWPGQMFWMLIGFSLAIIKSVDKEETS
jgi:O-antigen ligase